MKYFRASLALVASFVAAASATAQTYPPCSQDHPGHEHRAESLIKNGDASMARSAGGHAVLYAIERYGLKGYVTDADKNEAIGKMYDFLKWKMYSPANVAATWLADGYEHFDRAYVDEGAAMLLGLVVPDSSKPLIRIPKWFADHVMLVAGEGASAAAVEEVLKQAGLPSPFAHDVTTQIMEHFANAAIDDVQSVISMAIPREFDIDNRFVELAVAAKKEAKTNVGGTGRKGGGGGSANSTSTNSVDAKIAALEARIAALEREVAALKQAGTSGSSPSKGASEAALKPVDSGYDSVMVEFRSTGGTTLTIKLNGKVIGTYDESANIALDDLLAKGFENHLTFIYDKASTKVTTHATLMARAAPDKQMADLANFSPRGELEHTFDLPFKPKGG
jgi:hypothetical protein